MVADTAYYDALELSPTASAEEIRKSYKLLALKYHPDKNSSSDAEAKFKVIGEAYEVLSNPEARQKYDMFGKEGVQKTAHHDPFAMFRDIFGQTGLFGAGGQPRQWGGQAQAQARTPDIVHRLPLTLEQLYNGRTTKLRIPRKVLCTDCGGKGGTDVTSCADCKGAGVKVMHRLLGPGMFQQFQIVCDKCSGNGEMVKTPCQGCSGTKLKSESKIVEVVIEKGEVHDRQLVFEGTASEAPNQMTGSLVVIVQQTPHAVFERLPHAPDLHMKRKISLTEALTGFSFAFTHLDDRVVEVKSTPGRIVAPGQIVKVVGEGMPVKNGSVKDQMGDLFITFEVEFPISNSLSENTITKLIGLLPPKQMYTGPMNKSVIV